MWHPTFTPIYKTEIPWKSYVNEKKLPEGYKPLAAYDQIGNGTLKDIRRAEQYSMPTIDQSTIQYPDIHQYNQWGNEPKYFFNENLLSTNPNYFDLPNNDQAVNFDIDRLSADATKTLYKDKTADKLFGDKALVRTILSIISNSNLSAAEKTKIADETIKAMQNMIELHQEDLGEGDKDNQMRDVNSMTEGGKIVENKAGAVLTELQQKIKEYQERKKEKIVPVSSTSRVPNMTEAELKEFNSMDNRYVYPNPKYITDPTKNVNKAWMVRFPVYYTLDGKQVSKGTPNAKPGKFSQKTAYVKDWKAAIKFRDEQLKLPPRKEYSTKGKTYLRK